jgi:hypothetical protein
MRGYLNSEQNLPSLCCTLAQKLSIKIVKWYMNLEALYKNEAIVFLGINVVLFYDGCEINQCKFLIPSVFMIECRD